ncbi:unnamed protein product [Vitrella brassicaformis CCMP3155]|uniref:Uncharacterized protein n=1 Tax=Vitrella brassicaformis (strain CCMP3155) TaxID=1169540 RepID=A0A0G4F768_VITBC|nr:unnamed protein product [Vitrella brassicaformis CCMP3155]|eukprot:CEM07854.1 unnamed protein product [Vitrella brassicaformis CCMP3155]
MGLAILALVNASVQGRLAGQELLALINGAARTDNSSQEEAASNSTSNETENGGDVDTPSNETEEAPVANDIPDRTQDTAALRAAAELGSDLSYSDPGLIPVSTARFAARIAEAAAMMAQM